MKVSLLVALGLAVPSVIAQQPGSFIVAGDTLVSAMMMFVGGSDKVYIIDKVEGNAHQINGHSLYASVWDLTSRTATPMDVQTNPFCAAGMHLPNGSYATFGGNYAVGPGGDNHTPGSTNQFDPTYQDYSGMRAIRVISPCEGDLDSPQCSWYDSPQGLQMARARWYPGAEPLADGTIVLIGGFNGGGYINRNYPNTDPAYEGGAAEPTFEFFPSRSQAPQVMDFMVKTSGLNSFALTYLMPSGKMFVQANYSTILWDYNTNTETPLPDMPGQITRVYPASGANAMLPLTPANNYTPTIIFCGGQHLEDEQWGNYAYPFVDTWTIPASADCQRITPEPQDGSTPAYIQDDNLPVGRTMGQFVALPDGTLLVLNGGQYGTAGYAERTRTTTTLGAMPYGESLAAGPALLAFLGCTIQSAILLPDGSVMIAGSNPNVDVNLTTIYPTTYTAEYFYPPYFSASTRPVPQNIPTTLSYGGNSFDITVPSTSYSGAGNAAAANTTVWLIRQGFTTHAMNMDDGTITLHTAQLPPLPALFQPGPAFVFVTINGIPSNGTYVIVGNGKVGPQSTAPASVLPPSVLSAAQTNGSSNSTNNGTGNNNAALNYSGNIIVQLLAAAVALALS
ncbi:glyoxal oxidase [Lactarius deliciosus]|nr:glyoxal oxidase [Lactarius deliciosus]